MPPKETFRDDPLRVLRCIRFASRFGFKVVQELKDAAGERTVQVKQSAFQRLVFFFNMFQEALISKVSRERVGDEIAKTIKGFSSFNVH